MSENEKKTEAAMLKEKLAAKREKDLEAAREEAA